VQPAGGHLLWKSQSVSTLPKACALNANSDDPNANACSAAAQKRLGNVKPVAMDYVWDSASILTSFREELSKSGVIFCSMSEAVREYPDLVRQHLGSVVRWHLTAKCSAKCCRVAGRQTPVGEPLRLSGKSSTPCTITWTPWCVPSSLCMGRLAHRAATLEMLADR